MQYLGNDRDFTSDYKGSIMYEWESCLTIVRNYVYSN